MRVVLIGFACSYKTSVGKILADKLGYNSVDVDEEISRIYGCSVAEIFNKFGESGFRRTEGEVIKACCAKDNVVVSCGGGSPTLREFADLAKCSTVVWLQSSAQTVVSRLDGGSRPLFDGLDIDSLSKQISERNAIYALYAQNIIVSTDGFSSAEVAQAVYSKLIAHA